MNTFSHPHLDRLATQLIEKAGLDFIPSDEFPILHSLLLKEARDRFDRVLEFSFQLQPWEKMADFENRRG
jgi:hypothetical protein